MDKNLLNIVFYDGDCGLCNEFVDTLLGLDKNKRLLYAPLQGETAKALLPAEDQANTETIVFYQPTGISRYSNAVLNICFVLGGGYRSMVAFFIVPKAMRDMIYRLVAKNRHKIRPKTEVCRLFKPGEKERFLD